MNFKNDDGGITVLVIAGALTLLMLMSFAGFAINGFLTANRLNQAADRVALAAARQLVDNPESACKVGKELATSNRVNLTLCDVQDDEVTIQVKEDSAMQYWIDRWPNIGSARAGLDYLFD